MRIEFRVPGADANPYLAYAVTLAAGLEGIANKTEPPAMIEGDIYQLEEIPRVPHTLPEAISEMESSEWAKNNLGEEVVEHYLHFFKTEQAKFDEVVTDWERARYFERA